MKRILLFIACCSAVFADTHTATTCSSAHVQAAIDAASAGDTVSIPSGECTWYTATAGAPSVSSSISVTIIGNGIDSTVITDAAGAASNEIPLHMSGDNWRVTGITFNGMQKRSSTEPALSASGDGWRVDHCKFDATSTVPSNGRGMYASGSGVIDHVNFVNTYQGVAIFGTGDTSWGQPLSLGTSNAVYIEDCTFDYDSYFDGAFDAYNGARLVFRHNTIINTVCGTHGFDSGGYRSTFSYEIYDNTFSNSLAVKNNPIRFRGGTGVVYNNTLTGNFYPMNLSNYRSCTDYGGTIGKCDGTNVNDGNTSPTETNLGWPCKDQIGRTTNQSSYPVYEWDNTLNGEAVHFGVYDFCSGGIMAVAHIVSGRDYYNGTVNTSYAPYTYPHPLRGEPTSSGVSSRARLRRAN